MKKMTGKRMTKTTKKYAAGGKVLGQGRATRLASRANKKMDKAVSTWKQARAIQDTAPTYTPGMKGRKLEMYNQAVEAANTLYDTAASKEARAKKLRAKSEKVGERVISRLNKKIDKAGKDLNNPKKASKSVQSFKMGGKKSSCKKYELGGMASMDLLGKKKKKKSDKGMKTVYPNYKRKICKNGVCN